MSLAPLLYILLGAILWHYFKRQILTALAWLAFLAALALLLRAAPSIGVSHSWLLTSYGAGIVGFVAGGVLALRPIINLLVEQDRRRGHERVDTDHDKRRV